MEKKNEKPKSESIPPTDFKPYKKPKMYVQEKSVKKKKSLDDFFTEEWKNKYFTGNIPKPPIL